MSQKLIELKRDCYFYYTYPIVSKGRVNKSGPILPPLGYSLQGKKKRERTQKKQAFHKEEREKGRIHFIFKSLKGCNGSYSATDPRGRVRAITCNSLQPQDLLC
jgi:hypothetical protein